MRTTRTRRSLATTFAMAVSVLLAVPVTPAAASHGTFPVTAGVYRIPYVDGSIVTVSNDHHDHSPVNRIDMFVAPGTQVVASASGIIRAVVDRHGDYLGRGDGLAADQVTPQLNGGDDSLEHSCQDVDDAMGNSIPNSVVVGLCQDHNNYVWIEHPNGEWTKYTHFLTGTVTDNGWAVGDPVDVGDVLGLEGDVGRASGPHLHYEAGLPNDPNDLTPFTVNGGFMAPCCGINIVTLVCDIPTNLYATGGVYIANPCTNQPPVADAGGPYEVDEGSTVPLDGTGSTDSDGDVFPLTLTYLWAPVTHLDDVTLAQPTYSGVDDLANDLITLTVYDAVEAISDSDSTTVTVLNVPPTVTAVGDSIDEGGTATVSATFTDPGTADTHTATIDWDDGGAPQAVSVAQLQAGVDHVYGDDGTFAVEVTVTDDDGGFGDDTVNVVVANIEPTAVLGEVIYIAHAGDPVDVTADSVDPGSDDLTATWTWGDGQSEVDFSLVNPPALDQPKSPTIQPRDVDWAASHVYADACAYELVLDVEDDDGGSASDSAVVVITGSASEVKGGGWWMNQYRVKKSNDFTTARLLCYLAIVRQMSAVFDEKRSPLTTRADAVDVLFLKQNHGNAGEIFDKQLLAVWLNFANGAFDLTTQVDTTGDGVPDVSFANAVAQAEAVRLNPASTKAEILAQKDILETIVE